MTAAFYVAGSAAVLATLLMLTRRNAVHALLYLIVSLLAVAVVFYTLGAPFVAALEVIVYAGAIMVLFVFVVMLLNVGAAAARAEAYLTKPGPWLGPALLALVLAVEMGILLFRPAPVLPAAAPAGGAAIGPKEVAGTLFGAYVIGVELASMLLLAGLVGAYHIGRRMSAGTGRE